MENESHFLGAPRNIPMAEQIEVNAAIDKLQYGKFNSNAAQVEQQVRAEFRKRKALEETQGQVEES